MSLFSSVTLLLDGALGLPCNSSFIISLFLLLLVTVKSKGKLGYLIDLSESKPEKSRVWQGASLAR